ncbi:MAG: hypothetical protein GY847_36460 [Proteobacteria bacterium]|nr:hypothetical protein [Pseudomonadota bacterium]
MKKALYFFLAVMGLIGLTRCRGADEAEANRLCREAESLMKNDPCAALKLKRHIWEQMPTAGTVSASKCMRPIREKMGHVRVLVFHDKTGEQKTVEGCKWAAIATEVFRNSISPPFRKHWARRLMERCIAVVGRAWTRTPDDPGYAELNAKLNLLSRE